MILIVGIIVICAGAAMLAYNAYDRKRRRFILQNGTAVEGRLTRSTMTYPRFACFLADWDGQLRSAASHEYLYWLQKSAPAERYTIYMHEDYPGFAVLRDDQYDRKWSFEVYMKRLGICCTAMGALFVVTALCTNTL